MPQMPAEIVFDPDRHEYRHKGVLVPSVTQVLAVLADFSMVNPDVLEWKRNLGTQVHAATALDDREDLGDYDEQIDGYVQAWRNFRNVFRFEPLRIEETVFSAKHGFAGTLDRIGLFQGNNALLDIKTGDTPILYAGPQTAAYLVASTGNERLTMPRYMVRLFENGTYKLTQCKNKMDFQIFLNCLNIWKWRNAKHG